VQGHSRPEILAAAVFFSSPLISFSRDCVLHGLACKNHFCQNLASFH
jgi:hypothetical protein